MVKVFRGRFLQFSEAPNQRRANDISQVPTNTALYYSLYYVDLRSQTRQIHNEFFFISKNRLKMLLETQNNPRRIKATILFVPMGLRIALSSLHTKGSPLSQASLLDLYSAREAERISSRHARPFLPSSWSPLNAKSRKTQIIFSFCRL